MKFNEVNLGARVKCLFTSSYMFGQRHERYGKTGTIVRIYQPDEDYVFNFDVEWDDGSKDSGNWSDYACFELLPDQSPYVEPQLPCRLCQRPTRRSEKSCWWCGIAGPQRDG